MKQIQIIGNLGRDAQVKEWNGLQFCGFSVAVTEKYTDSNGDKHERTDWFNVTTQQINLSQYLTKGTKVFVQGDIRTKLYRRDDGDYQIDSSIRASRIQLLSPANSAPAPGVNSAQDLDQAAGNNESDDLPF